MLILISLVVVGDCILSTLTWTALMYHKHLVGNGTSSRERGKSGIAAEFFFFFEVIVTTSAAAEAPYAVHRLIAIPATSLGLKSVQSFHVTANDFLGARQRLQIAGRASFDHVFLLVRQLDSRSIAHENGTYLFDNHPHAHSQIA
jgi:hypothetical protein